jgi:hypothetical protein
MATMDQARYTRRELLRLVWFAGATAALPACLSCSRGPTPEEVAEQARQYSLELHCVDTAGLFPVEIATRTKNEYTERSTDPIRYCFNCTYFQPAPIQDRCGACVNVKGPIHPLGHCTAWTVKR